MEDCFVCQSAENLHRHHLDWHHENNDPSNVVTICARCHVALHQFGYLSREELYSIREKVVSLRNTPQGDIVGLQNRVFTPEGYRQLPYCRAWVPWGSVGVHSKLYPRPKAR